LIGLVLHNCIANQITIGTETMAFFIKGFGARRSAGGSVVVALKKR